jgi:phosphatidylserine decarboxylase
MGSMFLRDLFRIQPMHTRSPHIFENERNIIHVTGEDQEAYVVQIADQQVNKIDCYVQVGDEVTIGQKLGMIRRGSQVDLFLPDLTPADLPNASVGGKLRAGESTLRFKAVR